MKVFKIISVLAVCLTANLVHTQDVELDSYKFGEGLRFTLMKVIKLELVGMFSRMQNLNSIRKQMPMSL